MGIVLFSAAAAAAYCRGWASRHRLKIENWDTHWTSLAGQQVKLGTDEWMNEWMDDEKRKHFSSLVMLTCCDFSFIYKRECVFFAGWSVAMKKKSEINDTNLIDW